MGVFSAYFKAGAVEEHLEISLASNEFLIYQLLVQIFSFHLKWCQRPQYVTAAPFKVKREDSSKKLEKEMLTSASRLFSV